MVLDLSVRPGLPVKPAQFALSSTQPPGSFRQSNKTNTGPDGEFLISGGPHAGLAFVQQTQGTSIQCQALGLVTRSRRRLHERQHIGSQSIGLQWLGGAAFHLQQGGIDCRQQTAGFRVTALGQMVTGSGKQGFQSQVFRFVGAAQVIGNNAPAAHIGAVQQPGGEKIGGGIERLLVAAHRIIQAGR